MSTEDQKPDKENSKNQVRLAVIGLAGTMGVALLGNWEKVFPKPSEPVTVSPITSVSSSPSTLPSLNSAESFRKALELEQSATTQTSETIPSEENLKEIIQIWQNAIQLMKQINSSDTNYSSAVQKLGEYENQLCYIEALRFGMISAKLTQPAGELNTLSMEEWQNIENLWGQALVKLNAIPSTDPNYTRARQKIEEYERKQAYTSQARLIAPFMQGVRKANDAGNRVPKAQSQGNWLEIASLWNQAISLMKKVSDESSYYPKAQEKIVEYERSLIYAQQKIASWE